MLIYIIPVIIFHKLYGRKGFDDLETVWLMQFICFWEILLRIDTNKKRLVFIYTLLNNNVSRAPILFFIGIILNYVTGLGFPYFRSIGQILYNSDIHLKHNFDKIPHKPTIFLANYPSSHIEYFIHGLLGDKICLVIHHKSVGIVKRFYGVENLIPVYKEGNNFDKIQERIKEKLSQGYHIFSYIERDWGKRKSAYAFTEIRSGMFRIANNINSTITPIVIDHVNHTCGIIQPTLFNVVVGDTTTVDNDVEKTIEKTKNFFITELKKMRIPRLISRQ